MVTEFRILVTFGGQGAWRRPAPPGGDGNILLLDLVGCYKGEFTL